MLMDHDVAVSDTTMSGDWIGTRRDYSSRTLEDDDLGSDPFEAAHGWLRVAVEVATASNDSLDEANAMLVATVGADGSPSTRAVLLRAFDQRGFVFFTNYESAKGRDLQARPSVAATFRWGRLERQLHIRGVAERTSAEESDAYFASRPFESRIGAIVSAQSSVIESRQWLEAQTEEERAKWPDFNPPRPEYWGGIRIVPSMFEFWQGRRSRLHDRLRYRPNAAPASGWTRERLSP